MSKAGENFADLGDLQREIVQLVCANAPVTAETVRGNLSRPRKRSTVRTVLRRLEEKGYITHTVDGRTSIYDAAVPRTRVAAQHRNDPTKMLPQSRFQPWTRLIIDGSDRCRGDALFQINMYAPDMETGSEDHLMTTPRPRSGVVDGPRVN